MFAAACGGAVRNAGTGRVEAPDVAPVLEGLFRVERTFQEVAANSKPTPIAKYAVVLPEGVEDIGSLVGLLRAHMQTRGALRVETTDRGYLLGDYKGFIVAIGPFSAFLPGDPDDAGVRRQTAGLDTERVAVVELTPR